MPDEISIGDRVQYSETGATPTLRNLTGTVKGITNSGWIVVKFDGSGYEEVECADCFLIKLDPPRLALVHITNVIRSVQTVRSDKTDYELAEYLGHALDKIEQHLKDAGHHI